MLWALLSDVGWTMWGGGWTVGSSFFCKLPPSRCLAGATETDLKKGDRRKLEGARWTCCPQSPAESCTRRPGRSDASLTVFRSGLIQAVGTSHLGVLAQRTRANYPRYRSRRIPLKGIISGLQNSLTGCRAMQQFFNEENA